MDSDSFIPQFWKASRILGLEKLTAKLIETAGIKLAEVAFQGEQNSISWYNKFGRNTQKIVGYSNPSGALDILVLEANSHEGEIARFELIGSHNEGEAELRVYIPGTGAFPLLKAGGASEWYRHVGPPGPSGHKRGIIYNGSNNFFMAGGAALSEVITVEHGLEAIPLHVSATVQTAPGYAIVFEVRPIEVNEFFIDFQVVASSPLPGPIGPVPFTWIAMA